MTSEQFWILYVLIGIGSGMGVYAVRGKSEALIAIGCAVFWPVLVGFSVSAWIPVKDDVVKGGSK